MKMPIIEGLKEYIDEGNTRFHMPGHKGKNDYFDWNSLIPLIDVTEVEGTDNLHNPEGIIKESQTLAAITFGAKKTFYSVNGTTVGIYAAILSSTKPGDKILIQRNCHKSVYNALIFGRLRSKYIYPKFSYEDNILTGINPHDVENALKNDSDITAVLITYPSYYGICSDIKKIAEIVHKYNKILIVDEAHGSHFKFSDNLPISSLEANADIVIQSAHKTLPAFTQSSMIHVGSNRVDIERLKLMLSMFQSTSPSYMLMASLDVARAYMESEGKEKLSLLIQNITRVKSHLKNVEGIIIFDKENIKNNDFFDFDITKLLFSLIQLNISGTNVDSILRSEYKIQIEMSDYHYGLALTTVLDEKDDIDRLGKALIDISKNKGILHHKREINFKNVDVITKLELYEAFEKEKEIVLLNESNNKISGDFIIPYPPGIPILCPGELITKDIIEYINFLKKSNIQILGLLDYNKDKIKILK